MTSESDGCLFSDDAGSLGDAFADAVASDGPSDAFADAAAIGGTNTLGASLGRPGGVSPGGPSGVSPGGPGGVSPGGPGGVSPGGPGGISAGIGFDDAQRADRQPAPAWASALAKSFDSTQLETIASNEKHTFKVGSDCSGCDAPWEALTLLSGALRDQCGRRLRFLKEFCSHPAAFNCMCLHQGEGARAEGWWVTGVAGGGLCSCVHVCMDEVNP